MKAFTKFPWFLFWVGVSFSAADFINESIANGVIARQNWDSVCAVGRFAATLWMITSIAYESSEVRKAIKKLQKP